MGKSHRCYYCGSERDQYGCSTCKQLSEIRGINKKVKEGNILLEEIKEEVQFLGEDIEIGIGKIRSVLEWGLEGVIFESRKQTDLLESILYATTKPYEVEANNLREIGDELRKRGIFDKAEKRFIESLGKCELDYRTYLGLAEVHIKNEEFEKARKVLLDSIPHAPNNNFSSLSLRKIGRTYFTENKIEEAVQSLEMAVELSPEYLEANYEFIQYCALLPRISEEREKRMSDGIRRLANSGHQRFLELQEDENLKPINYKIKNELVDFIVERCRAGSDEYYKFLNTLIDYIQFKNKEAICIVNNLMNTVPETFYGGEKNGIYEKVVFESLKGVSKIFSESQNEERRQIEETMEKMTDFLISEDPKYYSIFEESREEFGDYYENIQGVLNKKYTEVLDNLEKEIEKCKRMGKNLNFLYNQEYKERSELINHELRENGINRIRNIKQDLDKIVRTINLVEKYESYNDLVRGHGEVSEIIKLADETNLRLEKK